MRRTPVLLFVACFAVLLVGAPPAAARQATPEASPAPLPAAIGEHLTWLLGVLNGGAATPTPEDVTTHFSPAFLEGVPAEQVVAFTQQLAAAGPYVLEGLTRAPTATQANALLTDAAGASLVVPVAIEAAPPHRITEIRFVPVLAPPGVPLVPAFAADGTPIAGPERLDALFDVGGGRRLYLSCVGTGSPTVVLDAADGESAATWFGVESAVAPITQVCSYDRPGTQVSASDPAPAPRTGADAVADLHALLAAAGVPGPYVLAGHSDGGLYARLYAHTYPDDVAGLVLVDPAHEDVLARLEALVGPELWAQFEGAIAQGPNPERMDFEASTAEVRAARAAAPLRPMPLIVVSAGQPTDPAAFPPGWPVEADEQLDRDLNDDLAGQVPSGRHVVAEQSGHYVHQTEPEVVVEAIRQVVEAVRDPRDWATPTAATPAP